MTGETYTLDDPHNGGSEPGAWAQQLEDTKFTNPGRPAAADKDGIGSFEAASSVGQGAPSPLPDTVNLVSAGTPNEGE